MPGLMMDPASVRPEDLTPWKPDPEVKENQKVYTIKIDRWGTSPQGTFGELHLRCGGETVFRCFTVERPWKDNQRNVSCIPAGRYRTKLQDHVKVDGTSYKALEILKVPGRDNIEIHIANTMEDVKGCIGVGDSVGFVNGLWAVTNSAKTYWDLMSIIGEDRCVVRIDWVDHGY